MSAENILRAPGSQAFSHLLQRILLTHGRDEKARTEFSMSRPGKPGIISTETQEYGDIQEPGTSDNVLVHQALAGNQKAFEALVSRYQHSLFGLIYRYVGEYHEAQDILQQVWLQLFLSLPTLHPHGRMRPWLFMVAHNRSVDVLRRRRIPTFSEVTTENEEDGAAFLDAIPDTSPTPEELGESDDLQRELQRAIDEIPCLYRSVVLLYYREQMNFAEIGRVLNLPVTTVKTRFQRAKPFLRAALTSQ
ncbi:MAG TPA: sigma-70 family RNA polymerase sigma factor [Ktedonobacteraceae bacterium]|nr:sigma-70 family RNA polymerase sigma factor [Ktedonobacteraceae bacterium]